MSRVIPRVDISQELEDWSSAVYGEEVRSSNVSALTKLQEQTNDACDMFEEIADDFDTRDTEWDTELAEVRTKATAAAASATSAASSKSDSEAYAIGKRNGTDVGTTDPAYHNNSKYYSEQASASAGSAATNAESAANAATDAEEAAEAAEEAAASVLYPVSYAPQTLTPLQQAQAATNIGLGDVKETLTHKVDATEAQSFTDTQKAQARSNIGVNNVGTLSYTVVSTWT